MSDSDTVDPLQAEIGGRLKKAMRDVGLVQGDLARVIEHHQGNVSDFLSGKKGLETSNLLRVLQFLALRGVNLQSAFTGTGPLTHVNIDAGDAITAATLRRLADQLEHPKVAPARDGTADQLPRPARKRRKA